MACATVVAYMAIKSNASRNSAGSIWVLLFSVAAMLGSSFVLLVNPEIRKDNMKGFWLLILASAGFAGLAAFLAAWTNWAFMVCVYMAIASASAGTFFGAWLSKTTTNREYLTRNLVLGACAGFGGFLVLMWLITKVFVFKGKESTWFLVILTFIGASIYFGYVLIYIILPASTDGSDWIRAVLSIYVQFGLIVATFFQILISLCKSKD